MHSSPLYVENTGGCQVDRYALPVPHWSFAPSFLFPSFRYTKDKKTKEQTPLRYVFNVSVEGNALTLAYAEPADNNATMILDKVPGIVPLMQTLNGTYTIDATAEPINPTLGSKMISTTNADVWFTMTGSIPSNN